MKIQLIIHTIILLFFVSPHTPKFKFDKEAHDFGKIKYQSVVSTEFKFQNVGDTPIIIKEILTKCGCTVALVKPEIGMPIKPGAYGSIKVTYSATAKLPFNKSITIISNAAEKVILKITGELIGGYE